jgi:hypothetical protein
MSIDLKNSDRYLDLGEFVSSRSSYQDFEGMASGEGILEMATKAASNLTGSFCDPKEEEVLRTLLCHYLYTRMDTTDDLPSEGELLEIAAAIQIVISSRYFLKETAK